MGLVHRNKRGGTVLYRHSVRLCRQQLLFVVVVVGVAAGPLDPGSGLTGTLHYSVLLDS